MSMCRGPQKNVAYEIILASPEVPCMSCSSYLDVFLRCEVNGLTAAVLWRDASRICSKLHIAFLCSSNLVHIYVKNLKATLLFIDFTKAIDSMHRGKMEQTLQAYGHPKEAIMMFYKNMKAMVTLTSSLL